MDKKRFQAGLIALALLAATAACLLLSGRGTYVPDAGIRTELPDRLLDYTGVPILFCQSDQCGRSVAAAAPLRCPKCGAALDGKARAEKALLPADTQIVRRRYTRPGGASYLVSIVLSGAERRGIHRPQVCLIGQGYRIVNERTERISLPEGKSLRVRRLDLVPPGDRRRGSAPSEQLQYWFQSGERRTPFHFVRLAWTAWDGAAHNRRSRWAYVTVAGSSAQTAESQQRFLASLHDWLLSKESYE